MKFVNDAEFVEQAGNTLTLRCDGRHLLHIQALAPRLVRCWLQPHGRSVVDRTWMIAPQGDAPIEGRSRSDLSGFPGAEVHFEQTPEGWVFGTPALRVEVACTPLRLRWLANSGGNWVEVAADRPTGAWGVADSGAVAHYARRHTGERFFGLGMKAGELERTGRRYEFRPLDAMGYDATSTDPLYHHWPFLLTARESGPQVGWLYDNLAETWFDLGNELDNYHLPYRRYWAATGDLDIYVFTGDALGDLTTTFLDLTGRTAFPPKWSLGYSGSTMSYTDAPNAAERLVEFIDLCQANQIACDSFQLSSGYTSIGDKRYVFNWNRDKFPDPAATIGRFRAAGLHLAANIKPCLLHDHPLYEQARALFIRDADGAPERSAFWDAWGSHLDFTNPETIAWWKTQVTNQLLDLGIDSTWNDNNEYEVWDEGAVCSGFGSPIPARAIRPLQPLLMTRSSVEAQLAHAPGRRPWSITRSGSPGIQRYAQTWSGDNRTSWATLRYNTRMGLSMSLSGQYNIGHDVGGFSGPRPDPEMFVRWVQNGVLHPRFTIHSWNDDGTVNEPWMHPEVTPLVRDAIALRYRLLPHLYTLLWRAHVAHEPIIRPTFLDHPDDPECWEPNDDFMLGDDLLVASVVEPGARTRRVHLPAGGPGWFEFSLDAEHEPQWHPGGTDADVDAPLSKLPLFIRAGGAIATSSRVGHVDTEADTVRELLLFPAPGNCESQGWVFDDDGVSEAWREGDCTLVEWRLITTAERIELVLNTTGTRKPAWGQMVPVWPAGETRPITVRREGTS